MHMYTNKNDEYILNSTVPYIKKSIRRELFNLNQMVIYILYVNLKLSGKFIKLHLGLSST